MAIGMPRDLWLDGADRDACLDYEKAWECKEIYRNQTLHLEGIYNHYGVALALANGFRKKGEKAQTYLEYPIPTTETERKEAKKRNILHTLSFVRNRDRKGEENA